MWATVNVSYAKGKRSPQCRLVLAQQFRNFNLGPEPRTWTEFLWIHSVSAEVWTHNNSFYIIPAHNSQVSNFYGRFQSYGMWHCALDHSCPKLRIPWPSKLLKYSFTSKRHIPNKCNLQKRHCESLKCLSSFLIRHFVATKVEKASLHKSKHPHT